MPFFDSPDPKPEYHGPQLRFKDWVPGVFTKPVYLFTVMKERGPRISDWIVPVFLCCVLMGAVSTIVFMSDSTVASLKGSYTAWYQEDVDSGEMTQEEVNEEIDDMVMLNKYGVIIYPIAIVILYPLAAFVFWLIAVLIHWGRIPFKMFLAIQGPAMVAATPAALVHDLLLYFAGYIPVLFWDYDHIGSFTLGYTIIFLVFIAGLVYGYFINAVGLHVAAGVSKVKSGIIVVVFVLLNVGYMFL